MTPGRHNLWSSLYKRSRSLHIWRLGRSSMELAPCPTASAGCKFYLLPTHATARFWSCTAHVHASPRIHIHRWDMVTGRLSTRPLRSSTAPLDFLGSRSDGHTDSSSSIKARWQCVPSQSPSRLYRLRGCRSLTGMQHGQPRCRRLDRINFNKRDCWLAEEARLFVWSVACASCVACRNITSIDHRHRPSLVDCLLNVCRLSVHASSIGCAWVMRVCPGARNDD